MINYFRVFQGGAAAMVLAASLLSGNIANGAEPLAGWQAAVKRADTGREPLSVVCIGDSNTEIFGYAGSLRLLLQSAYGNRGIGYYTLAKRMEELPDAPKITRLGKWDLFDMAIDPKEPAPAKPWLAPDGLWCSTSDATAEIAVSLPYAAHRVRLHYQKGPGLGSFEIRPAGGKPVTVACAADKDGYAITEFTAREFKLAGFQGKAVLFGLDAESVLLAGGAILHQLGNGWGMAHHYAAMEQDSYDTFLHLARPALITVLLGTNDMNNGWDAKGYAEQLRLLLTKLRKAAPDTSILVLSAPSCTFDRKQLSGAFSAAAKTVADEYGAAFWDLEAYLGENWRYWDSAGVMEYTLHYRPASGLRVALELVKVLGWDPYATAHQPLVTHPATLLAPDVKPAERGKP